MIAISKTARKRFFAKVDVRGPNECWEWDAESGKQFVIAPPDKRVRPHYAAWYLAGLAPPVKHRLYRVCGNLACVNVAHMSAVKPDWLKRQRSQGREDPTKPGPKRGSGKNSSLDVKTVMSIRSRIADGERMATLADEYGVSKSTLILIKAGKHWATEGLPSINRKSNFRKGSKLRPEDIHVIEMELARGVSYREIMGWFGVNKTTVYKIARGDHSLQRRGLA